MDIPLSELMTGQSILASEEVVNIVNLAIVAFERGDYDLADQRINEARNLLLLERKGNLGVFFYLYWHFVLVFLLIFIFANIFGYKRYHRFSINKKIEDFNNEEKNVQKLMINCQRDYFSGKVSSSEYHRIMDQHHKRLLKITSQRINLRNKRIKMLSPEKINLELHTERNQIESEIKKLQKDYYVDKKISEKEYSIGFEILNERLAEIEGEKITLDILEKEGRVSKGLLKKEFDRAHIKLSGERKLKILFFKIWGFLKKPFYSFNEKRELKKEISRREKIRGMGVI